MSKQSDGSHFDHLLYPDVAAAGDLCLALQAEFDAREVAWRARLPSAPGWRYVGAVVKGAERSTDTVMAKYVRSFTTQFWRPGVLMASGSPDDLSALAGAVDAWLAGARVRELASAWPFVKFGGFAEAYEQGVAVDYLWGRYLSGSGDHRIMGPLLPFLAAASHEPALRELVPFTSHWNLGLKTSVGHHGRARVWVVPLEGGRYQVRTADNREVGVGDADASVGFALEALRLFEAQ